MTKKPEPPEPSWLKDVKAVVAVASGKGGVGKSTIALNLAASLAAGGRRVGLLDADIYGPSIPLMAGLEGQKPVTRGGKIVPLDAHGLKIMSIGFLLPSAGPVVWRGAMVHKAIVQMIGGVDWGELDVLVVDMPPGTGDAHLTLVQKARPAGAVIVSTPQEVALIDARKAVEMFKRTGVRTLGFVETMSGDVFGKGTMAEEAAEAEVPFLGSVALDMAVRRAGDAGEPLVLAAPDSAPALSLREVAQGVAEQICAS